jgi:hypothetical protein
MCVQIHCAYSSGLSGCTCLRIVLIHFYLLRPAVDRNSLCVACDGTLMRHPSLSFAKSNCTARLFPIGSAISSNNNALMRPLLILSLSPEIIRAYWTVRVTEVKSTFFTWSILCCVGLMISVILGLFFVFALAAIIVKIVGCVSAAGRKRKLSILSDSMIVVVQERERAELR